MRTHQVKMTSLVNQNMQGKITLCVCSAAVGFMAVILAFFLLVVHVKVHPGDRIIYS